jgi:hypothetical protein
MTVTGPVMTLQVRERDEVLEPYTVWTASTSWPLGTSLSRKPLTSARSAL